MKKRRVKKIKAGDRAFDIINTLLLVFVFLVIFYPLYYESRYYACGENVFGIVFHPYDAGIDFISAGKGERDDVSHS